MNNVTLAQILASKPQWAKVAVIPKTPKVSYKIAKFIKDHLDTNWNIIEEQRNSYITQFKTSKDGEPVSIDSSNQNAVIAFATTFNEYLSTQIEVPSIDITMDEFIDSLGDSKVDEVMLLEIEKYLKQ